VESLRKVVAAVVLPRRADGGPLGCACARLATAALSALAPSAGGGTLATYLNLAAAGLSVFSFLVEALPLTETRAETAGRSLDGLRNINEIHTAT
jgi:hypothetical protein